MTPTRRRTHPREVTVEAVATRPASANRTFPAGTADSGQTRSWRRTWTGGV